MKKDYCLHARQSPPNVNFETVNIFLMMRTMLGGEKNKLTTNHHHPQSK